MRQSYRVGWPAIIHTVTIWSPVLERADHRSQNIRIRWLTVESEYACDPTHFDNRYSSPPAWVGTRRLSALFMNEANIPREKLCRSASVTILSSSGSGRNDINKPA